jgi:hypothetical protein
VITDKQIKDAENAAYKVSGHRASDAWTRAFAEALAASIAAHVFPAQLTTPLREVLGLMLWQTTPISHALRAAGHTIDRKAEVEQAHALHWLLGFALQDGENWHKTAAVALRKLTESTRPGGTS